jgi:aspartate carbamoyltransferase catalytic subunit
MLFGRPHLLGLEELTADEITFLLDTAQSFKEVSEREIKKVPALRGRTVINLFFESSTRTRTSFEIAAKRLSADTVNLSTQASSVSKGETLTDTARNLAAMRPDAIVVRHPSAGAAHLLARHLDCPIINAGDGSHEHPTQALLDLLTIRDRKGGIAGLTVTIVGDLLHSRVARSNLFGLLTMGAKVRFVGPPTLLPRAFAELGAELVSDLHEGVRDADVIMMLRIQRERMNGRYFASLDEYSRLYCLSADAVARARRDVIILHPGPMNRGVEISSTVADGPYSVIMDQVTNGVAVRMAVLYVLVGRRRNAVAEESDASVEASDDGATRGFEQEGEPERRISSATNPSIVGEMAAKGRDQA